MYPHERSLVRILADKPFAIIGVNSDQSIGGKDLETIREIVKEKNLTWRSFQNIGSGTPISQDWGVEGWPTIYLIDAEGTIRYQHDFLNGDLDAEIEKLMAEMGHEVKLVGVDHKAEDEAAQAD